MYLVFVEVYNILINAHIFKCESTPLRSILYSITTEITEYKTLTE